MKSTKDRRVKRTLTALLLMFVLSFSTVFAETTPPENTDNPAQTEDPAQTEVPAETGDSTEQEATTPQPAPAVQTPAPVPAATSQIIKKGKYYYYKYSNGKIRKKAGFVTVNGKKYYVKKGGKIRTSKTF